ncbi:26S proteasome non-ATPase regulatory subunit 1-like protein A-like [Gossypium australe]|uniref:26S proteasome non-ATPase regulatory subunit 1-like protein A-like n=1 Tax=Gossypium australe TaxID=47621 RepID=A0A5B6UUT9_9ROSI|nr:26S proteasome non-ATPase regulatory subunit 1-like protein A-like [Gossypium australe]
MEFISLKQNNMTVIEYEKEFVKFSKYAKELVETKVELCRRFEWGLNEDIFIHVTSLALQDLFYTCGKNSENRKRQKEKSLGKRVTTSSLPPPSTKRTKDFRGLR